MDDLRFYALFNSVLVIYVAVYPNSVNYYITEINFTSETGKKGMILHQKMNKQL